jgi:hypothetical protein
VCGPCPLGYSEISQKYYGNHKIYKQLQILLCQKLLQISMNAA